MKISIALCTYNGAKFLPQQLDSLSAQDRLPDEIIIFDDRSSDATVQILTEFSKRAPCPVSFAVNDTRLGVTRNFERAIAACSGDVVFFCDQDDYWLPAKLRTLMREFESDDTVGLVFSDAIVTDSELKPLGHTVWEAVGFDNRALGRVTKGDALGQFIRRYSVTGATAGFRASLRPKILPIPELYLHDAWVAFLAAACAKVVAISTPLIMYRQHGSNVAGAKKKNLVEKIRAALATPGSEFDLEIARSRELLERLMSLRGCYPSGPHADALVQKIRHLVARRKIFDKRLGGRIWIGLEELSSVRYFEYSSGLSSFLADVLLHR